MKILHLITILSIFIFQSSLTEASFLPLSHLFLIRGSTRLVPSTRTAVLRISKGGSSSDEEVGSGPHASDDTPPVEMLPQTIPSPPAAVEKSSKGQSPGLFRQKFPHLPYHRLPDYLTFMRCAAIPVLCAVFYSPGRHVESGLLFAFASLTDFLDGFLARRWDVSTSFGAFLDPVADKLMVSTALILLSGRHGAIVALPTCVILARELAVSALREWMAQKGQRDSVQVGFQGKLKTALTMVSLTLMLLVPDIGAAESWLTNLFLPSLASLYVCALITVTSGSVYFRAAAPILMQANK